MTVRPISSLSAEDVRVPSPVTPPSSRTPEDGTTEYFQLMPSVPAEVAGTPSCLPVGEGRNRLQTLTMLLITL